MSYAAYEMGGGAVVERQRFGQEAFRDEVVRCGAAVFFDVVMRAACVWQPAQAGQRREAAGPGVGDARVEPADRACADSAKARCRSSTPDAGISAIANRARRPACFWCCRRPRRSRPARAAYARFRGALEERKVRRAAAVLGKRRVEFRDIGGSVAACRWQRSTPRDCACAPAPGCRVRARDFRDRSRSRSRRWR